MTTLTNVLCATAALIALPLAGAHAQTMSSADRQKMLENIVQADANDDGAVSRAEFETLIKLNARDGLGRAAQVQKTGRYSMAFKRLDTNGDGFLTKKEMQALAAQVKG